jgi:hypothetical protein
VLTAHIDLPAAKYPAARDEIAFHRTLTTRLDALPGIAASGIVSNLPFRG